MARGDTSYRDRFRALGPEVQERIARGDCKVDRTCGDLAFVNCGVEVDGPGYYVHTPSHEVLEVCGGACRRGPGFEGWCVACPPPEWTCEP